MALYNFLSQHLPLGLLQTIARWNGSFRAREKFGVVLPPWYAYGVLNAAEHAVAVGVKSIWAIEFGVANGRGLRRLKAIADEVGRFTGVDIKIAGFDTGRGMPVSADYRDHPERYRAGDFVMQDYEGLKKELGGAVSLLIGDIADTIDEFRNQLTADRPVGFVAVDVDIYSAAKSALRLFGSNASNFLPFTFTYFDDSGGRTHFNKFCGELLAIEEFNKEFEFRKIDIDRGVWNSHRRLGPQVWYERMHITHFFDHPWRFRKNERSAKVLPERSAS